MTTALVAIVGQNWAAGHLRRVYEVYRRALTFTLSVGFVGMLAISSCSVRMLFSLIVPEREAYIAGGVYLRIVGLSQMFMMLEITTGGLFNGLGKTYLSAGIGIVGTYLRIDRIILRLPRLGARGSLVGDQPDLYAEGACILRFLPRMESPPTGSSCSTPLG